MTEFCEKLPSVETMRHEYINVSLRLFLEHALYISSQSLSTSRQMCSKNRTTILTGKILHLTFYGSQTHNGQSQLAASKLLTLLFFY